MRYTPKIWTNPRCHPSSFALHPRPNPGALHCILSCEMVSHRAIWYGTSYTHPILGCYPSLMGVISCINRCIVHVLGCSSPAREYSWCLGGTILKPCLEVWNHPAVDPSRTHPSSAWGKRISRSQNLEHTFALAPGVARLWFSLHFLCSMVFLGKSTPIFQDSDFDNQTHRISCVPIEANSAMRSVVFSLQIFPHRAPGPGTTFDHTQLRVHPSGRPPWNHQKRQRKKDWGRYTRPEKIRTLL